MAEQFVSVSEVLKKFGKEFVDALYKSLGDKDASGKLRESIRIQIKIYGQNYSFNILMEDYYKWVDEGRKPGTWPNIGKLEEWAKLPNVRSRLFNNPNYKKFLFKAKGKAPKTFTTDKSLKRIIGLKAGSIKKYGIRPTHFFTNVLEDGRVEKLQSDLRKALKKDIIVTIKEI